MSEKRESLTRQTGRALSWNYAGAATRLLLAFGINILLSRLLGPKPFGELAIATIVYGFGNLLASVGISSALIQKEELAAGDVRFSFTAQMLVGLLVGAALFFSAPAWAAFFHQPESAILLRVFSLLFVVQAFGTTATALLNRKQDARSIQIISIISYLIAYLFIGIPAALLGKGIWSLVIAQLAQALLNSMLSYAKVRHSLVPLLHPRHKTLLTFGLRILGANISSWGISNLDNTFVGRFAGTVSLGLYSRAFSLAALPAETILGSLLQVLLPAFARVQKEDAKLRNVYAAAFGLILVVLAPIFGVLFIVPDVVVLGLYGPKWTGAVPYFQPLALAIPINAVMALSGPLLSARGKPQREFAMQAITLVLAATAYFVAVKTSVLVLSWTVVGVYLVRFYLLTRASNQEIGGSWRALLSTATPGFSLAGVAMLVAKLTAYASAGMWAPARLAITLAAAGIAVLVTARFSARKLLGPILSRFPQMLTLVPGSIQRFVSLS